MASRARRGSLEESQPQPGSARTAMSDADFAAFYSAVFLPLVRRATWRHRLSKEDARDIVQDAFLLALQRIDLSKNPKAWLIQVVDHLALNLQRKGHRRTILAARWYRPPDEEQEDSEQRRGSSQTGSRDE